MTVRIYEYNDLARDRGGDVTIYLEEPSLNARESRAPMEVEITGGSVDSDQLSAKTHFVVMVSDEIFRYEVNAYNTDYPATSLSRLVAADTEVTLAVPPGGYISICSEDPVGADLVFNDPENSGLGILVW